MVRFPVLFSLVLFLTVILVSPFYPEQEEYLFVGTTEPEIHDLLNEHLNLFKSVRLHLENGDVELAKISDDEMEKSLHFIEEWIQSRNIMARSVRAQTGHGSDLNRLTELYLNKGLDAGSKQTEISMNWPLFLENHVPPEKMIGLLDEFLQIHEDLIETGKELYLKTTEKSVQINIYKWLYAQDRIAIFSGRNCSSEYTIENLHHGSLTNIRINIEGMSEQNDFKIQANPESVSDLAPGKLLKFKICFSKQRTLDGLFRLQVHSDQATEEKLVRIFSN